MNNKREMIDYLTGLGKGKIQPMIRSVGLCANFNRAFNCGLRDILDVSEYPNFSGCKVYPIKSPNKDIEAEDYYNMDVSMWSGRYGNERKRFCLWCAEQLEKDL